MLRVRKLHAREILDSRGNPTVEVDCTLSDGSWGRAAVPSGASTGKHEAVELRDGDMRRYGGLGVLHAVEHVNGEIFQSLRRIDASNQQALDESMIALDGTANKSRLGANAILGVSMAVFKAHAVSRALPLYQLVRKVYRPRDKGAYTLPLPMMNIMNGGAHADQGSDLQEFMILPVGARTMRQAIQMGAEVFHALKGILKKKGLNTGVGDEGGFAPTVKSNADVPRFIMDAINAAGYEPGKDIALGLDAAASEFYVSRDKEIKRQGDKESGYYNLKRDNKKLNSKQMMTYYKQWLKKYPFVSFEDPLSEDDGKNWSVMTADMGNDVQIVGDDIFVTNTNLLQKGIEEKSANAILIKLNQIGTITETVRAVDMADSAGWHSIVSHRSGETEDTTIADVVVGLGTGQIKTGSLSRTERTSKYNQLMRIEEELGTKAHFAGAEALEIRN